MTWEETIKYIRTQPSFHLLVEKAYFEEDLPLNVERFRNSEEFLETLHLLRTHAPQAQTILDLGAGNGVSSLAFALLGYQVSAIEPDPSNTIGAGAIRQLAAHYQLNNITVREAFAEALQLPSESFDIVYTRQCMHHAHDLEKFLAESARVLKKGGLLITVRDHVVFDETDKKWFLETHPLQKYYGGENAFSPEEYKSAMLKAGFRIDKELRHYDSVINYFPQSRKEVENYIRNKKKQIEAQLIKKISFFGQISLIKKLYYLYLKQRGIRILPLNERTIPGRMYSYICTKP